MSLLESILGSALGGQRQASGGGLGAAGPLLQMLMQMMSRNGQFGGLEGLLQQFQQAGLGQQAGSWVSTGQNMPISPEQLEQVFGRERLRDMATQAGMDEGAFGGALADALPQVIDRATPQGQVSQGGIDDVLASLSNLMPRN
jgi:uncharacterized protein YidB (DUF937 family)